MNKPICLKHRLFGVPKTEKARSQLSSVQKGDQLFLYVYGSQMLYGYYESISNPFVEPHPEKGPWNHTPTDKKHGYYPYRVWIDFIQDYQRGIPLKKIEQLDVGLDRNLLLRKSVVYISDFQANIIVQLLKDFPVKKSKEFKPKNLDQYENLFAHPLEVSKEKEEVLQLLVQKHFTKVENDLRLLSSYVNIEYGSFRGEIDILGKDSKKNYVVVEIKLKNLTRSIWGQVFSYSNVIRNIYAKHEGVEVRSFVICNGFNLKTLYSYPELKKLLKYENSLRVFKYNTDFKDEISFQEVPVVIN